MVPGTGIPTILAHEHDRVLVVAARGHVADDCALDDLLQVFLSGEEDLDVLVEAAAAVVAGVDDDTVAQIVFAEDVGVYVAVTVIGHGADVYVAQPSAG